MQEEQIQRDTLVTEEQTSKTSTTLIIEEQKAETINNIESQSIFNRITNNITHLADNPLYIVEFLIIETSAKLPIQGNHIF